MTYKQVASYHENDDCSNDDRALEKNVVKMMTTLARIMMKLAAVRS